MTAQDKAIKAAKHESIAAALAAAQGEMGRAMKSANNPHFRSKYADLASVMDACMPALTAHGIAVTQPVRREEGEMVLYTVLHHADSDQTLDDGGLPLIVNKRDMQGLGSALTYARRYGLMAMAGIAPDDDDGNAAAAAPPPKQERREEKPATITADQFITIRNKADEAGVDHDKIAAAYNAPTLEQLLAADFDRAMKKLQATIDAKKPEPANADLDGDSIPY